MHQRSLILLGLIFCLSLLPISAKVQNAEQIKLYYGLAEGSYLIRDYKGAENSLRQILRIDPNNLSALRLQVRIDLEQDQGREALAIVEQILDIDPDLAQNQLLYALVLGHLGQREQAMSVTEKLITETPKESLQHQAAARMLGLFQMADSDWTAAAETFYEMYAAAPEEQAETLLLATEAFIEQAQSFLKQNNPDAALKSLDEALLRFTQQGGQLELKQSTRLRLLQAQILTRYGRIHEAIQKLEVVVRQQSDHLEARVTLASLYAANEQWDALHEIIEPIKKTAEYADISRYFEGRYDFANGRIGSARTHFEAALEQLPAGPNPLRPTLRFYQGACFDRLGKTDQANASIIEALNLGFQPEAMDEAVLAAEVCLRTTKADRAVQLLEQLVLTQKSISAKTWALLGRAHEANKQPSLALSAYNQSLQISPTSVETLALRASLLRALGDLEGAATDYERALTAEPGNSALNYALGIVAFQMGQLELASEKLAHAQKRAPNHRDRGTLLCLLNYTLGDSAAARQYLVPLLTTEEANSATIDFLNYLLSADSNRKQALDTLRQSEAENPDSERANLIGFFSGQQSLEATLNQAGIAETPEAARRQISSTAFWMAQFSAQSEQTEVTKKLLQITLENGSKQAPEFLCAQWQINQMQAKSIR